MTIDDLHGVLRASGFLTNRQAWELARVLADLIARSAPSGIDSDAAESSEQPTGNVAEALRQHAEDAMAFAHGMRLDAPALPPLPEPHFENHDNGDVFGAEKTYFYTAEEMRAYAESALEMAAKVCEERWSEGTDSDAEDIAAAEADDCAKDIRALKQKE